MIRGDGIEVVFFFFFGYMGGRVGFSSVVWYGEIDLYLGDSLVDSCVYEEFENEHGKGNWS